jgi:NADH-quinone oxidoreductase subunit N
MDFQHSLWLIAPEELLSLAGLALLLVAAWGGDKAARLVSILSVAALVGAALLVAPALCSGAAGAGTEAFSGQYRADAFASFAKLLIYGAAGVTLIVAPAFFDRVKAMRAEFPLLILFAALGAGMMVSAGDLLTLYIGLELNSLASYVLAAFLRSDDRSAEAGLKYFVLGALASGILLFGMSLVYGFTGATNFASVRAALSGELGTGALFGVIFMLSGLAFKIAAAPFHMWTPDVYEGAPTPVTMFFATAPKVAAMALTMRVALEAFGDQGGAWRQIVIFAALLSIVIGALGAIGQANIKRLMAYSSINNVGFILIGLAAATPQGASAMLVYLAIYVATTIAGFVAILLLRDAEGAPPAPARRRGRAGRGDKRSLGPVADPAVAGAGARIGDVQPGRHPAAVRVLGQVRGVPRGGPGRPHRARRNRHSGLGHRRVLLHQDRQDHVLRRGGRPRAGQGRLCPHRDPRARHGGDLAARLPLDALAGRARR